jgi:hypothetical protein
MLRDVQQCLALFAAGWTCDWALQARPGEDDDDDRILRRHLPRSAYRKPLVQSDDDDDAAEASEDAPEAGQDEAQRTPSRKLPPPVSARCTKQDCNRVEGSMSAGLDIVTLERLCAVHVCIVSPDGQTRLCYNANTLQARHLHASAVCHPPCIWRAQAVIASPSGAGVFAVVCTRVCVQSIANVKGMYMQPPHFRQRMAAHLVEVGPPTPPGWHMP